MWPTIGKTLLLPMYELEMCVYLRERAEYAFERQAVLHIHMYMWHDARMLNKNKKIKSIKLVFSFFISRVCLSQHTAAQAHDSRDLKRS